VERYANLVYSAALRQTGAPQAAEDLTQTVFFLLAKKAKNLRPHTVLSAWLFQTTRHVCADLAKASRRQRNRELKAAQWQAVEAEGGSVWGSIAPVLDEGLASLSEVDRHSVLLRFFEERPFLEVAARLGVSEDAAKKRVARAIEKLRAFVEGKGIAISASVLLGLLGSQNLQAAPPTLASAIVSAWSAGLATA